MVVMDMINLQNVILEILNEATDPRYNPSRDAIEAFFEIYDTEKSNLIYEFLENPNGKQSWKFLPFPRVMKIWSDFSKTNIIRDDKGLDLIGTIIIENIAKVYANTMLSGHTQNDPKYELDDILPEGMDISEFDWDAFYEYITDDSSGHIRLSDYAMDDLLEDAARILDATTDVDKIISIDRALNRIHRRSDIAGWFLQGGTDDLNKLSSM